MILLFTCHTLCVQMVSPCKRPPPCFGGEIQALMGTYSGHYSMYVVEKGMRTCTNRDFALTFTVVEEMYFLSLSLSLSLSPSLHLSLSPQSGEESVSVSRSSSRHSAPLEPGSAHSQGQSRGSSQLQPSQDGLQSADPPSTGSSRRSNSSSGKTPHRLILASSPGLPRFALDPSLIPRPPQASPDLNYSLSDIASSQASPDLNRSLSKPAI